MKNIILVISDLSYERGSFYCFLTIGNFRFQVNDRDNVVFHLSGNIFILNKF